MMLNSAAAARRVANAAVGLSRLAPKPSSVSLFSTATIDHDDGDHDAAPKKAPFGSPGHRNAYQWNDPLLLRSTQLTEEERNVWDMAKQYCQSELMPGVLEANRNESGNGRKLLQGMGEVGLLGATLPSKYGGSDLGYVSYGLLTTEVERVDSGYRSCMSVQSSLVMYPIYQYGSEYLRTKYLPELASGNFVGCFGLTEPNHGRDKTTKRRSPTMCQSSSCVPYPCHISLAAYRRGLQRSANHTYIYNF